MVKKDKDGTFSQSGWNRINLHVVFDALDPEVIRQQFLGSLAPSYQLIPDSINWNGKWKGVITRDSLAELGQMIMDSAPAEKKADYAPPLQEGFNNLCVSLEKVVEALDRHYFAGKYLIAVGKTEWDNLKWDDQSIAEKRNIINQADLVFKAAGNPAAYDAARKKLSGSNVKATLLDCSDAETFELGHGDDRVALIDGVYAPLSEAAQWTSVTIERGQTLGEIFAKFGISSRHLARLVAAAPSADSFTRLRPGDRIGIRRDAGGALTALQLDVDSDTRRVVEIDGDKVSERTIERPLEKRRRVASGQIIGSLFSAGEEAGLDDGTIIKLAKVFGYDIDFAQDLRRGDQFAVVFEEFYRDGEVVPGGDIIAATFVNRGRRFDALRFEKADGSVEYYDQAGRPLRKAFIRTPVEFSRISSRFSSARRHPILGTVRAHKGVDYAAPSGTPIMAAAVGRVSFAGWKTGYGRVVIIDHGRGHSTLYAHMSRFGTNAKVGTRVRQGDNIGYVGMTGLATAPHLHYEFRINGVHRDPLKVTLTPPEPLPGTLMAKFRAVTAPFIKQLAEAEQRSATIAQR